MYCKGMNTFLQLPVFPADMINVTINTRQRIPQEQSKMDNPDKLATQGTKDEDKQHKNTTEYVLDTTLRIQTQIT